MSDQVLPHLHVGGLEALHAAANPAAFDAVLSIGANAAVSPDVQRVYVELLDSPDANLLDVLPNCLAVLGRSYRDGQVSLAHCAAGQSRSVAVVAAFLMVGADVCLAHSLALVAACRRSINVNA